MTVAPLIVAMDKEYAPSGPGVVSHRNMLHVGYNGYNFRKLRACPELHNKDDLLVKEALPARLLNPFGVAGCSDEPVYGSESVKCAPESWVLRRPVAHFADSDRNIAARYPPRNMLNAKYKQGPRTSSPWMPTGTYREPPVPLLSNSAAFAALQDFNGEQTRLDETLNVLDVLRCVYHRMGVRQSGADQWLQKRATRPTGTAIAKYNDDLHVFNDREKGHPAASETVRQVFKNDSMVQEQVEIIRRRQSCCDNPTTTESASKIASRLFDEASSMPGGLDRFEHLVELDLERYAKELKVFKEITQRKFDEEHGLLPSPSTRNSTEESTF